MKEVIIKLLKKGLKKIDVNRSEEEIEKLIEVPPSQEMGDYSFPCFSLAEELKDSPHLIALKLKAEIGNYPKTDLDDVQTAGPYVNFFLDRKNMAKNIVEEILEKENKYGGPYLGKGKKVVIEHTSINPNASPHLGRARNAIIGDSLVRIYRFLGFAPDVHYYINDVSKQIAMLALVKAEKLPFSKMLKKYGEIAKKLERSKKLEDEVFGTLFRFEHENKETINQFKKIVNTCVKGQKEILAKLGIKYNSFDYESKYLKSSQKILKELKKTGKLHKDKTGRLYLDLRNTSVQKKMKCPVLVLTRNDGTGLYPLRDISYTIDKMKISPENLIVLGEDQKLYFEQIKEALRLLGKEAPKVVHYSFILLTEKGKSKKMSTRKGDVVLLEDFLTKAIKKAQEEIKSRKTKGDPKKVGIGAVKYSVLKNGNNKTINFNLEEALNFEGNTGPYIMYSYARASSIMRKAKKSKGFEVCGIEEKEFELASKLSKFPEIVLRTYKTLNPSLIANYVYETCQIFNEFYHSCPVIGSENEPFRLALVQAFRQVVKNSMNLLGIELLEEM